MTELHLLDESKMFGDLFQHSIRALAVYSIGSPLIPDERKDIVETFAQLFTYLDTRMFQCVFENQMQFFFDAIVVRCRMILIDDSYCLLVHYFCRKTILSTAFLACFCTILRPHVHLLRSCSNSC